MFQKMNIPGTKFPGVGMVREIFLDVKHLGVKPASNHSKGQFAGEVIKRFVNQNPMTSNYLLLVLSHGRDNIESYITKQRAKLRVSPCTLNRSHA